MTHLKLNPVDSSSVNAQVSSTDKCGYDADTAATGSAPPHLAETIPVSYVPTDNLLQFSEPLAAISIRHLSPGTRLRLAGNALSVNAYPDESGGFVYVGAQAYQVPSEPDLAEIFALARRANIVWLKFDRDAGIVEGLPLYDDEDDAEALS
jgi:hypothetical protein